MVAAGMKAAPLACLSVDFSPGRSYTPAVQGLPARHRRIMNRRAGRSTVYVGNVGLSQHSGTSVSSGPSPESPSEMASSVPRDSEVGIVRESKRSWSHHQEGRTVVDRRTLVYVHGFLSSAASTKAAFLEERLRGWPAVDFGAIDLNPTPRDFATMTMTGQINRLRQYLLDRGLAGSGGQGRGAELTGLIGSSLGGWVSLHYAHLFGGVERLLLLAPALVGLTEMVSEEEAERWRVAGAAPIHHPAFGREIPVSYDLHQDSLRYLEPVPAPVPTLIIHGLDDEHVPIHHSREYASTFPDRVRLLEVRAGHDLNEHLEMIWRQVESFLLGAAEAASSAQDTQ